MTALERQATTTNVAVFGAYHERTAATDARVFECGTAKLSRWLIFVDATRASSCSVLYEAYVVGRGSHDAVGAWLLPDQLETLAVLNPTVWLNVTAGPGRGLAACGRTVYARPLHGPSSLGFSSVMNATLQATEDGFLSGAFWRSFQTTAAEVARLEKLAPGWDSHGAHPVGGASRNNAINFLGALFAVGVRRPPAVGASPTGGVVFQWFVGEHEIFVEVDERRLDFFAAAVNEPALLVEGTMSVTQNDEVARSLAPYIT